MMEDSRLYFYEDDFKENPRDSEFSEKVVSSWLNKRRRYAVEDIDDPRCLRLVAERLLVRRVLGMEKLDAGYVKRVEDVKVFGADGPSFRELSGSEVFVAMAFFPVTPPDHDKKGVPHLARLYCASGLADCHKLKLEGMDESALKGYSWFLEGIPANERDLGIHGRSWLLAAHLLARIVAKRDAKTARNLMKNFIVTGDVQNGVIHPVELGRKSELAEKKPFRNFIWIIPKENNMDIAKRKMERPATLEEAFSLIESMHSVATKSFFRFLREGNLDGMKEQFQNGADLYATEEKTGLMPIEVAAEELEAALRAYPQEGKKDYSSKNYSSKNYRTVEKHRTALRWLQRNHADCTTMYYVLAHSGLNEVLALFLETYPINARNADGATAMDMALIAKDFDAAEILKKHGGTCSPLFRGYPELELALVLLGLGSADRDYGAMHHLAGGPLPEMTPGHREMIIKAIKYGGLSPDREIDMGDDFRADGRHLYCSIFGLSIYHGEMEIAEACLQQGVDANALIHKTEWIGEVEGVGMIGDLIIAEGTPMEIVQRKYKGGFRDKFVDMLKRYGAKDVEVATSVDPK